MVIMWKNNNRINKRGLIIKIRVKFKIVRVWLYYKKIYILRG